MESVARTSYHPEAPSGQGEGGDATWRIRQDQTCTSSTTTRTAGATTRPRNGHHNKKKDHKTKTQQGNEHESRTRNDRTNKNSKKSIMGKAAHARAGTDDSQDQESDDDEDHQVRLTNEMRNFSKKKAQHWPLNQVSLAPCEALEESGRVAKMAEEGNCPEKNSKVQN